MDRNLKIVIGLGLTGYSCVRYLTKKGYQVAVMDTRNDPPYLAQARAEFPDLKIVVGGYSKEILAQANELIVSPGIALAEPELAELTSLGIPVVGDIELFAREARAPVVAITGSNGKSTVTTLVGLMAKEAGLSVRVGGNIGVPALDLLEETEPDCYVLELSSFQLETTYTLQTAASVVLNICVDHMDRYTTLKDYIYAKLRIYNRSQRVVLNADEPETWQGLQFACMPYAFSTNPLLTTAIIAKWLQAATIMDTDVDNATQGLFVLQNSNGEDYLAKGNELLMPVAEMKLQGLHHYKNALAALALGSALGLPTEPMLTVLRNFAGLDHRCQWVREYNGVVWYNDSKGTNVGATQAALMSLGKSVGENKVVLIAGGQGKNADFSELNDLIKRYVKHLVLLGEDAPILAQTWQSLAPITRVNSMQEAVHESANLSAAGDVVLLSPACASLDMFKNYEHRGHEFVAAVQQLA